MQQFMRLDRAPAAGAVVLDTSIEVADDHTPGVDIFTEEFAALLVPFVAGVQVGYAQDASGKFAAPPEPTLSVDQLAAYAKQQRDQTEAAGLTVNGVAVASDPDSQTRVANAYSGMQVTGAASIRFKATAGFIVLTLDQVKAIGSALFAHTQACFDAEDQVDAGLSATPPTITTTAQVDAIFAGVKSAY